MSKKVSIVLLIVGIAALVGVLLWGIGAWGGFFPWRTWDGRNTFSGEIESVSLTESPADAIRSVNVSFVSEDVVIAKGSGDKIRVEQFGPSDLSEEYLMRVRVSGSELIVESGPYTQRSGFLFGGWNSDAYSRIEISLPRDLADSIAVATTSGTIDSEGVSAPRYDASSVSGDVTLASLRAQDISCSTTSGNITVENAQCDTLGAGTVSGTVNLDAEVKGNLRCDSTSGELFTQGSAGSAVMKSISGDVDAQFTKLEGFEANTTSGAVHLAVQNAHGLKNVSASTVSGDVTVSLPSGTAVNPDFSSASGSMHTSTGTGSFTTTENGLRIQVDTASGDFTLSAV